MRSTQPHSPLFHLVDPVHSHSYAGDKVLPTFHLGRSVREWAVPAPCLPLLPPHHCLLSDLHICSRPSHYCWFQCYRCSISYSTALPATLSDADDMTDVLLQLQQFQFDKYWKMARPRPLPDHLQLYRCTEGIQQQGQSPRFFSPYCSPMTLSSMYGYFWMQWTPSR